MRTAELLRKAADALDAGEDPFGEHFLSANGVTIDQCMTLAGQLATGARIVARAIENPRSAENAVWAATLAESL